MPKISIVVATYRREDSLIEALNSLSNQTYDNYEIVLVDDNDEKIWNDKVKRIVDNFKKENKNIDINFIVNHPNQGSAKTRNIGIEAAKGDYITFLDDDDLYFSSKIECQLKYMIDNDADYSITDLYLYNEDNKLVDKRIRSYIKKYDKDSLLEYHLMHHMTGTDTLMFKKEYLLKIGMFDDIDIGDEFYLMMKAIEGQGKLCYIPECDVKAFVHQGENGLSSGKNKIDGENQLFEFKKKYFSSLNKNSIRYIKMRHHAVLAIAYLKINEKFLFFKEAIYSFFVSPRCCIKLLLNSKK